MYWKQCLHIKHYNTGNKNNHVISTRIPKILNGLYSLQPEIILIKKKKSKEHDQTFIEAITK